MLLQNSASNVQWRIQIQNCFGPFSPAGLGFGRKNKVGPFPGSATDVYSIARHHHNEH